MVIAELVLLLVIFGIQIFARKTRFKDSGFFGLSLLVLAILVVFGFSCYQSYQQYVFWKSNDLSKLYLPPYQPIDYFVFYARTRFFNPYIFSLLMAILFLLSAKALNKKYQERFFERIEPYLLAISMFVAGNPMWLFYLIILLTLYLLINSLFAIHNSLFKKGEPPRIPLYYLWLPSAIFTILISKWLSEFAWWQILKF